MQIILHIVMHLLLLVPVPCTRETNPQTLQPTCGLVLTCENNIFFIEQAHVFRRLFRQYNTLHKCTCQVRGQQLASELLIMKTISPSLAAISDSRTAPPLSAERTPPSPSYRQAGGWDLDTYMAPNTQYSEPWADFFEILAIPGDTLMNNRKSRSILAS